MSDSLITKRAMADSLKSLMKKKSLERITVSDIVKGCGLNRQTFYYHFKDKYDLVNWIYYSEIITTLSPISDGADWSAAIKKALNIMRKDKAFYAGSLNLDGQSILRDYLFRATRDMLIKILEKPNFREATNLEPDDRILIAEFYTYGLVGMVIQWVRKGMAEAPDEIVEKLSRFIDDSEWVSAVRSWAKNNTAKSVSVQQKKQFPN
jgi:probable dihydroxyacetone kinase regulator